MCEIYSDEDRADVFKFVWPRAKIWHNCHSCWARIAPGEKYLRLNVVAGGSAYTEKACRACGEVMLRFGKAHKFTPCPSSLCEFLAQCVDSDEDDAWLVDLSLMLRRNANAKAFA